MTMQQHTTPDPLGQLERFLGQDPQNESLLAQAFETALRAGNMERAQAHLHTALRAGHSPADWGFRQAHWLMAAREWGAARQLLQELRAAEGAPTDLVASSLQDEACIALYENQPLRGIELLAPFVAGNDVETGTQALWLRLLHKSGRTDDAFEAARTWEQAGTLAPEAMAVASLVALDQGDLDNCRAWADRALAQGAVGSEVLVARASVALGDQDAAQALNLLERAMARNATDSRTLSTMGYALMLSGQLQQAVQTFRLALQSMPNYIGSWQGLAWSALLQGDLQCAAEAFHSALTLDRNFAESQGGMAVVMAKQGHRAAAEQAIHLALRLDPNCMSARYAQATLNGSASDATAMHQLAVQLLQQNRRARGD